MRHFCHRGQQNLRQLKKSDFSVMIGGNGKNMSENQPMN